MLQYIENKIKELEDKNFIYLNVKVHTGATKTIFKDILQNGTVKIDIASQPEKGKANNELIKYLQKEFSVEKSKIKIISGKSDKNKLIKIKN